LRPSGRFHLFAAGGCGAAARINCVRWASHNTGQRSGQVLNLSKFFRRFPALSCISNTAAECRRYFNTLRIGPTQCLARSRSIDKSLQLKTTLATSGSRELTRAFRVRYDESLTPRARTFRRVPVSSLPFSPCIIAANAKLKSIRDELCPHCGADLDCTHHGADQPAAKPSLQKILLRWACCWVSPRRDLDFLWFVVPEPQGNPTTQPKRAPSSPCPGTVCAGGLRHGAAEPTHGSSRALGEPVRTAAQFAQSSNYQIQYTPVLSSPMAPFAATRSRPARATNGFLSFTPTIPARCTRRVKTAPPLLRIHRTESRPTTRRRQRRRSCLRSPFVEHATPTQPAPQKMLVAKISSCYRPHH